MAKQKKTGLGLFGGTFDPIHCGHIQSVQSVASWLNLEKVLIIPAHIPPHKSSSDTSPHASSEQRATMVELACQHHPVLACDRREIKRAGYSYTVDTLKQLKQENPDKVLYFIIGMDSLQSFTTWHQHEEILTLCHLVVNTRPNYCISQLNEATKALIDSRCAQNTNAVSHEIAGKILFANPIHIDISSSQIRQRIQNELPYQQWLSSEIIEFINKNQLYR
ncbi:nicotinate-nucleotide adenylyltransferase [Colwellia sp. RSH04]|uniref:nicotinate-nucleotide adenylyltransferase n=1 Tax=Colwellia sp. RSH04 TaxID=2305464 RepID=UPI000E5766C6|nr:nicotinate-nucleotide adenylyltransferase [Colwellia sp. RSH04]RHW75066.1 nicotinate-nucleotide adenylyltransferase [Colwellia sp. RSH04]